MTDERLETGNSPDIFVSCQRDLQIRGWAEGYVKVTGENIVTSEGEKGWRIESGPDLRIMVPNASKITVVREDRL